MLSSRSDLRASLPPCIMAKSKTMPHNMRTERRQRFAFRVRSLADGAVHSTCTKRMTGLRGFRFLRQWLAPAHVPTVLAPGQPSEFVIFIAKDIENSSPTPSFSDCMLWLQNGMQLSHVRSATQSEVQRN
jgi:hypothetical protein